MINFFLRYKVKNNNSNVITENDIDNTHKIIFILFTRYGDTIISLEVIKEFIKKYPNKKYLIITKKPMTPYIKELLPNIDYFAINKRNIFNMLRANSLIKKFNPDIGFSPWSHGSDSKYFLTYCKKYFFYKDYVKTVAQPINHYQVVRKYLTLENKEWKINQLNLKNNYEDILICPQSTDNKRSIQDMKKLVNTLKSCYKNSIITIATMDKSFLITSCNSFIFKKTKKSSNEFLSLVKKSNLVICADSGPLHLSIALKKDTIGIFNTTDPKIVINLNSKLSICNNENNIC